VDDRQSTYFRKLAVKTPKFQGKRKCAPNKQTNKKEKIKRSSRHGILSNGLSFLDELEDNAKNLSTTTKSD
jgi:hypothetical protein